MTRVCAWCPTFDPKASRPGVSHGICPDCRDRMIHELMKLPTRVGAATLAPSGVASEGPDVE